MKKEKNARETGLVTEHSPKKGEKERRKESNKKKEKEQPQTPRGAYKATVAAVLHAHRVQLRRAAIARLCAGGCRDR